MCKYHSDEHHHRTSLQVCYQGQNRMFLACRKSQSQFSKCFICHSILYNIYKHKKYILKKKQTLKNRAEIPYLRTITVYNTTIDQSQRAVHIPDIRKVFLNLPNLFHQPSN